MKPKLKQSQSELEKDNAFFLSAPEISIFVACCVMVNELRGLERALAQDELTRPAFDKKSKSLAERLTEAAEATHRFDVVFPVTAPGEFSPFFWRWFNWWDDYLKSLTPSQVAETERRARDRGSLVEDLRPEGHWVRYRNTPAITLRLPVATPPRAGARR